MRGFVKTTMGPVAGIAMTLFVLTLVSTEVFASKYIRLNQGTFDAAKKHSRFSLNISGGEVVYDFVIQFKNQVTESDKETLKQYGMKVQHYIPDDAVLVTANEASVKELMSNNDRVYGVLPFVASYKISNEISPVSVFSQGENKNFLISTYSKTDAKSILHKLNKMSDVQVLEAHGESIALNMPTTSIYKVAALKGVEHVQYLHPIETFEMKLQDDPVVADQPVQVFTGDYTDLSGFEDGTKVMNFESAWTAGLTGKGHVASLADTGVDLGKLSGGHPDLDGAVKSGYAFGKFSRTWEDPMGHGTHCAGSIMGHGTHSNGLVKGGAYEASIVAESMWSPMMNNLTVPSKLSDLFQKAYNDGARVHSNSWGAPFNLGAYDDFAQKVDQYMWDNPEMLVIYAAGNSGEDTNKDGRIDPGSVSSPGTSKNSLTVGASENTVTKGGIQVPISQLRIAKDKWGAEPIFSSYISDNKDGVAMFSSRGPTLDGRTKPEVVAPGTNILSLRSQHKTAEELWGAYNQYYTFSGGTSMATPLVAGAAVLTRQALVEKHKQTNPSAALVKATLMHTAVDMFPGQYGEVGVERGQEFTTRRPNSDEGYGRVDMKNVASLGANTTFVDNKTGLATNEKVEISLKLKANSTVLANLVYTDAPASPNAQKTLVNDLDLELVGPSGNVLNTNVDRTNNNEIVETKVTQAGTYKLVVKGYNVPQGKNGKQPFALVYSVGQ